MNIAHMTPKPQTLKPESIEPPDSNLTCANVKICVDSGDYNHHDQTYLCSAWNQGVEKKQKKTMSSWFRETLP